MPRTTNNTSAESRVTCMSDPWRCLNPGDTCRGSRVAVERQQGCRGSWMIIGGSRSADAVGCQLSSMRQMRNCWLS